MHLQTHFLSGWIVGNLIPRFGKRERFLAMLAAVAPDADGLTLLAGWKAYHDWHHVLTHNLLFAVLISGLMAAFSQRGVRFTAFAVYLGLIHLHFAMDLLGSGEGWGVDYWRPFDNHSYMISWGWEFYSWQNMTAGALCIAVTVGIIYWKKRTFLEYPMPKLDRELTAWFLARIPTSRRPQL